MAERKLVAILFHKPSLPYQPGDHAAFTPEKARHFVEAVKVADYADEKGKATDEPVERPRAPKKATAKPEMKLE
jgi:hypothetical protein